MPDVQVTLTGGIVAEAVQGRLVGGSVEAIVGGVSIDSRTIDPQDLFVAVRGDQFDGHDFVGAAIDRGAMGAVVSRLPAQMPVPAKMPPPVVIQVADTLRALQALGQYIRRASGARVVAITGSAGKTTTKEVVAAFLGTRYRVFRNRGNLNNHIGLPLSLTELRDRPDVAVVELGMNHAGEIRVLVGLAEPEVRVWTNVAEVHSAFFTSVDSIADAKAEILERASPQDVLVANADDARVMARASRFAGTVRTFGMTRTADVMATDIEPRGLDGMTATIHTAAGTGRLQIPLLGRANLANVLAAAAVALNFQVPLRAIVERAATLEPVTHRGQVLALARGVTLIDDSYNSNPVALERALDVLHAEARHARRIAVLGEMLELGERALSLHEAAGRTVAASAVDVLVTVGGEAAEALGAAAIDAGLSPEHVVHVQSSDDACRVVSTMVQPDDLVLVKGSRGFGMETIVARLRAEFA